MHEDGGYRRNNFLISTSVWCKVCGARRQWRVSPVVAEAQDGNNAVVCNSPTFSALDICSGGTTLRFCVNRTYYEYTANLQYQILNEIIYKATELSCNCDEVLM